MEKIKELDTLAVMATCSDLANDVKYEVTKLEAIRSAVSRLITELDETDFTMCGGMGQLILQDVTKQIRLIDMALCPLVAEMEKDSKKLTKKVDDIYDQLADEHDKKVLSKS